MVTCSATMSRILQVVPTYYPAVRYGGPIRSVHGLSSALARRGHDVHVYTTNLDGPSNLDVPLDKPVDLDGVQVHYFDVPALRRLHWSPRMGERLRAEVGSFDIVHLQSTFLWPTWAAARAARQSGVPYLLAPRGMLGKTVIHGKNRWLKQLWIELIERRSLAQSAGVHVTVDLEAEEISALSLPMPRVFCVPNGIERPAQPMALESGPFASLPRPYVLFLSRINWKKGLDRLIKAWQWIPDVPLVIAGYDENGYRATLDQVAREANVTDRVHFIGPAPDEHKWALFANAALFALPSYSENFANVVAEAMSMACPVVVTPEVGLASLVRETGAGAVTSGEPAELAATIRTLLADAEARHRMGRAGQRAVAEHLSWNSVAARMEEVYESVVAESTPLVA
jgi:glycosyltransferase involved in cell wall biosynthesis